MKKLSDTDVDIINEFEVGSPHGIMEKTDEYYLMYLSRYGIDPRSSKDKS